MSGRPYSILRRITVPCGLAIAAALLVPVFVAGSPARAESDRFEKRLWAVTGTAKPIRIDRFREMREDCALAPAPVIAVLQQPKVGKLKVASAPAAGATDKTGPYAACDGKTFNWTTVTLPAAAKADGTDHAVIQATESSGDVTVYDIEIVFAKKLPAGKSNGLYEER